TATLARHIYLYGVFTLPNIPRQARRIWFLIIVVFIADLLLPRNWDVAFGYLLAMFLSFTFREKSDVLLLAVITTVLAIIAAMLKPQEVPLERMLFERLPAILGFWASAFFVIRFIELREDEKVQEGRFKALFEYATNGIILANQSGKIVMANPAAEMLFGYEKGEMLGETVEALIPPQYRAKHIEYRNQYQHKPSPRNMAIGRDLYGVKKDGTEFPVEISLSPYHTSGGDYSIAFILDNTYRKNYENSILQQKQELSALSEALKQLNEGLENKVLERTRELEQAKNEIKSALDKERELGELKSRFVSMASHEFRTPLTSVLSSAGLIGQYSERGDLVNIKKHAARIKNAVNGLNTILTEFLSLGRLEEGRLAVKLEMVDLEDCVQQTYQEMRNLFKAEQQFEHHHKGKKTALLDCALLKNILINLISNAIKYSPETATITVLSEVDEARTRITVRDQGIGIPLPEQKHLFDRFFRATNATNIQGTGLGLYIVQRYTEAMGGKIGFKSEVEKGSDFWVEFDGETRISST
ncbi:MAG: PAS domain-containing sensor histidine kinase, partial [Saprospiraceae bacterium]|nr:PAS domain-containing sensor histidine kinase [Saprospiraceae bacterium]